MTIIRSRSVPRTRHYHPADNEKASTTQHWSDSMCKLVPLFLRVNNAQKDDAFMRLSVVYLFFKQNAFNLITFCTNCSTRKLYFICNIIKLENQRGRQTRNNNNLNCFHSAVLQAVAATRIVDYQHVSKNLCVLFHILQPTIFKVNYLLLFGGGDGGGGGYKYCF